MGKNATQPAIDIMSGTIPNRSTDLYIMHKEKEVDLEVLDL
jgi:hypothetical protein